MQVLISPSACSEKGTFSCSLGDLLATFHGDIEYGEEVFCELDTDECFEPGINLLRATHELGVCSDGDVTKITGLVSDLVKGNQALLTIGRSSLVFEYIGEIAIGDRVTLIAKELELFPINY